MKEKGAKLVWITAVRILACTVDPVLVAIPALVTSVSALAVSAVPTASWKCLPGYVFLSSFWYPFVT